MKRAYRLTVDRREAAALERILRRCASTAMEPLVYRAARASAGPTNQDEGGGGDPLPRYDDNRNGRIGCKEARQHGIAPVHRSHRRTGTCGTGTEMAWSANSGGSLVGRDVRADG